MKYVGALTHSLTLSSKQTKKSLTYAQLELMPSTNFRVVWQLNCEQIHSDWLKLVTWLSTANQSALFPTGIVILL